MQRSTFHLVALLALLLGSTPKLAAQAQQDRLCFPTTGQCVEGRFRQYWEQNGGLAVFGYPVAPAQPEVNRDTGKSYLTQWFERNRFELHPESAAPYDVLLGRLGDDRLRQTGVDWQTLPKNGDARTDCLVFPQTGHKVCDMAPGVGFQTYWRTHGLKDPNLSASAQSLALFGLPLSEPRMETNASGDTVLTQWFERARFEWRPDKPVEYKVLLGLLGNEIRSPAGMPPAALEYAALGDSLATGFLSQGGYVARFKDYLETDLRNPVTLNRLAENGWSSVDLLRAVTSDQTFRATVARSRVITWDIGGNDFRVARQSYKRGTCGGSDNQNCFREVTAAFKQNWSAILREILALRTPRNAALRTMDVYNPYVQVDRAADSWADDGGLDDFQAFKPYVDEANSYIRTTAAANGIPCAEVYRAFNGARGDEDPGDKGLIGLDRLHPSEAGHQVIADQLRGLGYAPLK